MSNPNEVKVQRYHDYGASTGCVPCADGDWVKYSDYQSLESKLATAQKENESHKANYEQLKIALNKDAEKLATANAKIVELEATQLSLDDICYRKLNSELEAELSTANKKAEKLVEALERLCPFLNNPQWGNWDYMEGSNVYTDIRNAKETVEQAINEFKGEK